MALPFAGLGRQWEGFSLGLELVVEDTPTEFFMEQQAGFTVVAEKLNFYRYLSHFRAVHRGAFFSEMRTTSVRKLLPEAWGKWKFSELKVSLIFS